MIGTTEVPIDSINPVPRAAPERPHGGAYVIRAAPAAGIAVLLVLALGGCGGGKSWTARDVPEEYPTIQAAVDAAQPGDLVRVGPGIYREQVVVGPAKHDVVIRGTDRNRVVLDGGGGARFNGITVHADGVAVENLTVRGYATDGVVFTPPKDAPKQLNGWRASYVTAANNGLHGIEALRSRGGTIDHVLASGHGVAGFRIGNCRPCDSLVTDSVAERGMAGFEGSDSGGNVVVARSFFRDNRVGVLLVSAGKEEPYHQQDTTVVGNVIEDNANQSGARARRGLRRRRPRARRAPRRAGAQPHHRSPGCRRSAHRLRRGARGRGQRAGQRPAGQRRRPRAGAARRGSARPRARASPRTSSARRCRATSRRCCPASPTCRCAPRTPTLPIAPPGADWRNVRLPAPQPLDARRHHEQAPAGDARPGRIDVARVGVPGQG